MAGNNLKDLSAFVMVAEECSFTRAAARLGVSQSALSQTIRGRGAARPAAVCAYDAQRVADGGWRKAAEARRPAMSEIDAGLEEIGELIGKPTGVIRLTADEFAVQSVLQPAIARFLPGHPGIRIEITTDYGLADIVDGRFDAGVRRGRLVAKDMIAVRIGPTFRWPSSARRRISTGTRYPSARPISCRMQINLRLPTHGEFLPWIFTRASNEHRIKVDGPLVYTSIAPVRDAALAGLAAYLPVEYVRTALASGQLIEVLGAWRKTFEGYHLYYASRRHATSAFSLLVDALKYRKA